MIKVSKLEQAPDILRKRGKQARDRFCAAYDRSESDYISGKKKFEIKSDIYGGDTVKDALKKAQHDKCCFCESKISHISYGDVEHFRPKAGWRQRGEDRLEGPGYYWLAYEWTNLFLSCTICNQRFKGNLFPLKDPEKRARSHHHDLIREEPLFVDPATLDPEEYISFRHDIPYAIDDNRIGKVTIEALGLDRSTLNEMRRDHLKKLALLYKLIIYIAPSEPENRELQQLAQEARAVLDESALDSAAYAAATRAALKEKFRWSGDL